ncbi:glycosyl hydrolase family 28-related protein [Heyndrickxia acidiproducens]|uniref:glycosyl hydrolase family 28-related protein n=1 Tax=Heyndrickxia acidiproducens TaxID=1121084 RepID=UPI000364F52B|nr:glycosyl hydrolase family 28-related protein [Heyndrickxia acidiproducens]
MLDLNRNHDPLKNADLIQQFSSRPCGQNKRVEETRLLFQKYSAASPRSKKHRSLSYTWFNRKYPVQNWKTIADQNGLVYPEWKKALDQEYIKLLDAAEKVVNVLDFGAVGDGKTDNTKAFKKAIGKGYVRVRVPAGVFLTKGIQLPSWTCLEGEGKGVTTIKLHPDAPKKTRLVSNSSHMRGNSHILVQNLSLDWNLERLGVGEKSSAGNNRSSCLTFAHVSYGWVKHVEAINAGLHGFDVSSTRYHYLGDGFLAPGRSRFIWLDGLTAYGFGDDGITNHHSDYIFISNSHCCDPSGRAHKKGFSNSNGIEIDDGSRHVWLCNNSSARCFGGVEIKAHHNASAASNVHIFGHLSVNDNRSFNFRHIGHHKGKDTDSKTAHHIVAAGLVSIAPIYTDLYENSTPRSLVVSAYQNVVINGLTAIGDPDDDFKGQPVIAVQYRAKNVVLNDISVTGFKNAKKLHGKKRCICV